MLSEWSTYSLSDLLLFSPRTYYRLLELYNTSLWPAHLVALAAGGGVLVVVARATGGWPRAIPVVLAIAWCWVAWGFLLQRYATINWAATYFAAGFGVEALLLLLCARRFEPTDAPRPNARALLATATAAFAIFGYPFIAVLAGRGLATAEVFGLAPDPTALATLALLVAARPALRFALMPIPFAWAAISGATLWAMAAPDWWVLPAGALLALVAAVVLRRAARAGADAL